MKNQTHTAASLIFLSASLCSQAVMAMDTQVSAGLITSGTAKISSSASSTFGYDVKNYSGTQLGLALLFDNHNYLMANTRNIKGTADFAGEMTRTDNLIAWSPGYNAENASVYFGWKTGDSKVAFKGKDMYNFSSNGPFLGMTKIVRFTPNVIGSFNLSVQYIMQGTYRPSSQIYADKSSDSMGYGGGIGLTYLINDQFTVAAEYKGSWNSYKFKTECYNCKVGGLTYTHFTDSYYLDEAIYNAEFTLKYKF